MATREARRPRPRHALHHRKSRARPAKLVQLAGTSFRLAPGPRRPTSTSTRSTSGMSSCSSLRPMGRDRPRGLTCFVGRRFEHAPARIFVARRVAAPGGARASVKSSRRGPTAPERTGARCDSPDSLPEEQRNSRACAGTSRGRARQGVVRSTGEGDPLARTANAHGFVFKQSTIPGARSRPGHLGDRPLAASGAHEFKRTPASPSVPVEQPIRRRGLEGVAG